MIVICPHCSAANRLDAGRTHDEPVCGKCGTALLDGAPVVLDEARFDRFVGRSDLPVVVDFCAAWCGPCRVMAPQFEQAARQLKGQAVFAKVDSDASPTLSARLAIRSGTPQNVTRQVTFSLRRVSRRNERTAGTTDAS